MTKHRKLFTQISSSVFFQLSQFDSFLSSSPGTWTRLCCWWPKSTTCRVDTGTHKECAPGWDWRSWRTTTSQSTTSDCWPRLSSLKVSEDSQKRESQVSQKHAFLVLAFVLIGNHNIIPIVWECNILKKKSDEAREANQTGILRLLPNLTAHVFHSVKLHCIDVFSDLSSYFSEHDVKSNNLKRLLLF